MTTQYAVVRRWQTRKRVFQIVVGPFPTRYRAQRTINEYVNEWGYWDDRDQFTIAIYRTPTDAQVLQEVV